MRNMFGFERANLSGLGLMPPFALQITRYPPGTVGPGPNLHTIQPKKNLPAKKISINPNLNDYQKMYRDYASGMLNITSKIIPPTHPLYTRENTITTLQDENKKLLKENLELKNQLDNLSRKSSGKSSSA